MIFPRGDIQTIICTNWLRHAALNRGGWQYDGGDNKWLRENETGWAVAYHGTAKESLTITFYIRTCIYIYICLSLFQTSIAFGVLAATLGAKSVRGDRPLWLAMASCFFPWSPVASSCLPWPPGVSCGLSWPLVAYSCLPLPPVASGCLSWSPVYSRGLPWLSVASQCFPWSLVVSRGYSWSPVSSSLPFLFVGASRFAFAARISFWPIRHCHPPTLFWLSRRHHLIYIYIYTCNV